MNELSTAYMPKYRCSEAICCGGIFQYTTLWTPDD